jgi:hypothetical protein
MEVHAMGFEIGLDLFDVCKPLRVGGRRQGWNGNMFINVPANLLWISAMAT